MGSYVVCIQGKINHILSHAWYLPLSKHLTLTNNQLEMELFKDSKSVWMFKRVHNTKIYCKLKRPRTINGSYKQLL